MAVRAITFDLWRTLIRDTNSEPRNQHRFRAFCRVTGVSAERVGEASEAVKAEFDRMHRGEKRTPMAEDFVHLLARHFGVCIREDSVRSVAKAFSEAILDYPPEPAAGGFEAVRAAAGRFPVGLICDTGNSPGWVLRKLLDRFGVLREFQVTVFSDEMGVSKPQPVMFERAAAGLGVEASELLHIGDLEYTDIVGIQGVGGKAVLFAGENREFLETTRADYVLREWGEFDELLKHVQVESG